MHALVSVAAVAASVSLVEGGLTGSIVAESSQSSIFVAPGDAFTATVWVDAADGETFDFALFRVVIGVDGLEHSPDWFSWADPFITGGVDDFSKPAAGDSGAIDGMTFVDPFTPSDVDVAFENVSAAFGDTFGTGGLLSFTLRVPTDFELQAFDIAFVPDTFARGIDSVTAEAGTPLTVTVVPSPASWMVLALGTGSFAHHRRRDSR